MPSLVGQKAPAFKLDAMVNGDFKSVSLEDYKGKWLVAVFYPLDFTFVCPTEVTGMSDRLAEFQAAGAEVVAVSIDSKYSHKAWYEVPRNRGGIAGTKFPVLADINKTMARDYGVLLEGPGIALRATFLIDPDGVIQAEAVNNTAIGRDVDDILRTLLAA